MPNKRDLKLDEYGIDKITYRELYYFCLSYQRKKEQLRDCYELPAMRISDMPRGGATTDITSRQGERAAALSGDTEAIEQALIYAVRECGAYGLFDDLLENVTQGISGYSLGVPRHKQDKFYKARRCFFFMLAKKLKKI